MTDFEKSIREEVERAERNLRMAKLPQTDYQVVMIREGSHRFDRRTGVICKVDGRLCGIHTETESTKWGPFTVYVVSDLATGGRLSDFMLGFTEACEQAGQRLKLPKCLEGIEAAKELLQDGNHFPLNDPKVFEQFVQYVHESEEKAGR